MSENGSWVMGNGKIVGAYTVQYVRELVVLPNSPTGSSVPVSCCESERWSVPELFPISSRDKSSKASVVRKERRSTNYRSGMEDIPQKEVQHQEDENKWHQ